ncbi:MAG: transporter [Myxococcota bacterium]
MKDVRWVEWMSAALLATVWAAGPAAAQEPPAGDEAQAEPGEDRVQVTEVTSARSRDDAPEDVSELDLEGLLDTRIDRLTAPGIGHTHRKGEVMIGYRLGFMMMGRNLDGTKQVEPEQIVREDGTYGFMAAPKRMRMKMHMLRLMYAPHVRITIMGMVPYVQMSMSHVTRSGAEFATEADGLGDVRLAGLISLLGTGQHRLHVTAGASFPTGSFNERGDIPMMPNARLPYPMQIGSGTFDLRPAVTYRGIAGQVSWGGLVGGVVRLGENDNGYRRGNRLRAAFWGSVEFVEWFSLFVLAEGHRFGDVQGADPVLDPNMVPTADPDRQGGTRVDGSVIVALDGTERLEGLRVEAALGAPMYQRLDGPQLAVDFFGSLSIRHVFGAY